MPRETRRSRAEIRRTVCPALQELVASPPDSYGILESDTVPWVASPLIAITYGNTDMALQLHSMSVSWVAVLGTLPLRKERHACSSGLDWVRLFCVRLG